MTTDVEEGVTDHKKAGGTALMLGALGVVFGDIGTSPLYSMKEAFNATHHSLPLQESNVFGILSLITWSLIIISIKYVFYVMRADNEGEGGILALTALSRPGRSDEPGVVKGKRNLLILVGLFGTALLYGDGVITPAISVLSAVEGVKLASPGIDAWVVPIAVVIIVALFAIQPRGTAGIGKVFGPVMVVWFATLSVLGVVQIAKHPSVLAAVNPVHALRFFADNQFQGVLAMGAVCLVVTGGEALYADMGHFGKRPIQQGWFLIVFPALLLNYFGQGALLIDDPSAIENPFYRMAPSWALYPLLIVATLATVIASQALISGAFSLTKQAVQLSYSPRVKVLHTSKTESGQIYIPSVNWALMVTCIAVVVGFRTSSNLAAAYGLAVTLTMVITTIIFYFVARERLGITGPKLVIICSVFLAVELGFLTANVFKIPYGGWFPLVVGAIVFTVLTTWYSGRRLVAERTAEHRQPLDELATQLDSGAIPRFPGTAVYLFRRQGLTPTALSVSLRHHHSIHERIIVLSILTAKVPHTDAENRGQVTQISGGLWQVVAEYGFLDEPNVPDLLAQLSLDGVPVDLDEVTYFLGSETLHVTDRPGMAMWRERLFRFMVRNSTPAASYFFLPDEQTIAIGIHVEL